MLFRKNYDRARALQREQRGLDGEDQPKPEKEQIKLERGDGFALFLSAMLTLFLPGVAVLLALAGVLLLILWLAH